MRKSFALVFALLGACGGGNEVQRDQPIEHWATRNEWVLSSPERCVTGPFEVKVPALPHEFGRRFTLEAFGPRALPFDTRREYADGSGVYGWGWKDDDEMAEAHAACRAHDESAADTPAESQENSGTSDRPRSDGTRGKGGASENGNKPPAKIEAPTSAETQDPSARLPTLEKFDGELPLNPTTRGGIAWYPQGNPTVYSIDSIGESYYSEGDERGFTFKFWFHKPVDMEDMVIRIRDQVLVPNGAIEPYRKGFAARVAEVERRLAKAERVKADENIDPARGAVPPPPQHEERPASPGDNVDWLPGYWKFHAELEDFVWVGGTFVVREPPAAEQETSELADASGVTNVDVDVEAETAATVATVTLEPKVPPRPAPRKETIPPAPKVAGALWIPGYWELKANAWHWVGGRWQLPSKRGARFRAPSVEVRAGVKVYVPGGWSFSIK